MKNHCDTLSSASASAFLSAAVVKCLLSVEIARKYPCIECFAICTPTVAECMRKCVWLSMQAGGASVSA